MPAAQGPIIPRATIGTTPDIWLLLAEEVAGTGEERSPLPGSGHRPRPKQPDQGIRYLWCHLANPGDLDLAGLPIEPAITVKS